MPSSADQLYPNQIVEIPSDEPLVVQIVDSTGSRFATAVKQKSLRSDILKLKVYTAWSEPYEEKLIPSQVRTEFVNAKGVTYLLFAPMNDRERESCLRAIKKGSE